MTFLKLNFPGWSCGDVIWCCLLSASSRSHKHNIEPAFTRWVHSWNFYQNFLTLAATMFVNRDIFWVLPESFHILLLATKLAPPVHNSFHFYPINTSLWRPSSIVGDLNLCSCTQYLGSTQHWQTCFLQTYLGPALIKSFTSFPSSSHLYSFIQDSCGIYFPCWTKWFAIMWRGGLYWKNHAFMWASRLDMAKILYHLLIAPLVLCSGACSASLWDMSSTWSLWWRIVPEAYSVIHFSSGMMVALQNDHDF